MRLLFLGLIYLLNYSLTASGSADSSVFKIAYKKYEDGIAFRFFPKDILTWQKIAKNGIGVVRWEMPEPGGSGELIKSEYMPTKALDSSEMMQKSATNADLGFIMELLYPGRNSDSNDIYGIRSKQQLFPLAVLTAFKSLQNTHCSGLGLLDQTAKKGKAYLYQFFIRSELDTVSQLIYFDGADAFHAPSKPGLLANNISVNVEWDITQNNYMYYFIQKSVNGIEYQSIHKEPIYPSLKLNGKSNNIYLDFTNTESARLYYRFKAYTLFGDSGVVSDATSIDFNYQPPLLEPQNLAFLELNNRVKLVWDVPNTPHQLGFSVRYSATPVGAFCIVRHISQMDSAVCFIDTEGYYQVCWDGTEICSNSIYYQINDSMAPLTPVRLMVEIDKNRFVNLSWTKSQSTDAMGYKVFRSFIRDAEFTCLTNTILGDTFFLDTLRLSVHRDSVYYRIEAVDFRYNESVKSRIWPCILADLRLPETPVITNYKLGLNRIDLFWEAGERKPKKWTLIKRSMPKGEQNYIDVPGNIQFYTDTAVLADCEYEYELYAVGKNDSLSHNSPRINVKTNPVLLLPKLEFSFIQFDSNTRKLYFYWKNPENYEISHFKIWRNGRSTGLQTLCVVGAKYNYATLQLLDYKPEDTYLIQYFLKNGKRSAL